MTTKIAVINEIVKETEKAILVSANYNVWLPKSQIIAIYDDEKLPAKAIEIPTWLWMEHRHALSITTTQNVIDEYLTK